jgi:hypothetical protein
MGIARFMEVFSFLRSWKIGSLRANCAGAEASLKSAASPQPAQDPFSLREPV